MPSKPDPILHLNELVERALALCETHHSTNDLDLLQQAQKLVFTEIPSDPHFDVFTKRRSAFYMVYEELQRLIPQKIDQQLEQRFKRLKPAVNSAKGSHEQNAVKGDYAANLQKFRSQITEKHTPYPSDGHVLTMPEPQTFESQQTSTQETLISPAILANKLKVAKVLVCDVRSRDQFERGHINSPLAVCFEPSTLRYQASVSELEDALVIAPAEESHAFSMRHSADMVVLYDLNSETARNSVSLSIVAKALERDGVKVYILKGGFESYSFDKRNQVQSSLGPVRTSLPTLNASPLGPRPMKDLSVDVPNSEPLMEPNAGITHYTSRLPPPIPQVPVPTQSVAQPQQTQSTPYLPTASQLPLDGYTDQPPKSPLSALKIPRLLSSKSRSLPAPPSAPAPPPPELISPPQQPQTFKNNTINQSQLQSQYPPPIPPPIPQPQQQYSPSLTSAILSKPSSALSLSSPTSAFSSLSKQKKYVETVDPALLKCTGLKNLGNTCYMNCVLQCLISVTPLTEPFLNGSFQSFVNTKSRLGYQGKFAKEFSMLVRAMLQPNTKFISPLGIKEFAGRVRPHNFAGYEQQDCQEFLTFVLDALHEDLNVNGDKPKDRELSLKEEEKREQLGIRLASAIEWERYLKGDTSLVVDLFQGQYLSQLKCQTCKHTSTTYNAFASLSLPIVSKGLINHQSSLKACFDEFVKPEILDGDNAWFCPHCKQKRRTLKTMQISRLPPVLIIHLKRFKHGKTGAVNKLETSVEYPVRNLDLTKYWPQLKRTSSSQTESQEAELLAKLPSRGQTPPFIYDLRAVTLHSGTLKGGHYTAIAERPGLGWFLFDDSIVHQVKEQAVVSKNAYVLVYKRRM